MEHGLGAVRGRVNRLPVALDAGRILLKYFYSCCGWLLSYSGEYNIIIYISKKMQNTRINKGVHASIS